MKTRTLTQMAAWWDVNEDRAFLSRAHRVVAVLDGEMQGGRAADIAMGVLETSVGELDRSSGEALAASLSALVQRANDAVVASNADRQRMSGTSLTICTPHESELVVVHVGDTRLYVADRGGTWRRVTRDHSLREDPRSGRRTEDLHRHLDGVVTRLLYGGPVVDDVYRVPLRARALLCTDGLWRSVEHTVDGDLSVDDIDALMGLHDGKDDATLVSVDWSD